MPCGSPESFPAPCFRLRRQSAPSTSFLYYIGARLSGIEPVASSAPKSNPAATSSPTTESRLSIPSFRVLCCSFYLVTLYGQFACPVNSVSIFREATQATITLRKGIQLRVPAMLIGNIFYEASFASTPHSDAQAPSSSIDRVNPILRRFRRLCKQLCLTSMLDRKL